MKAPAEFEKRINKVRGFVVDDLEEVEEATKVVLFDTLKGLLESRRPGSLRVLILNSQRRY